MKPCSRRRLRRSALGAPIAALTASLIASLLTAAPVAAAGKPGDASADQVVLIAHVSADHSVRALVRAVGRPRVHHAFSALHAFSVRVPAADAAREAARLRALPGVTTVERSVARRFFGSPNPDDPAFRKGRQPYLAAIHAPQAWSKDESTQPVKIAIVDSGVDVQHPDLQGKIAGQYDAIDGSTDVGDDVGHGTFVAGVAAAEGNNRRGLAGADDNVARIYAVKIADPQGDINVDDEVKGIQWAVQQHVAVINLSLGGADRSSVEEQAIEAAIKAGVVVVAAAGNDGDTARSYPAAYPGVIAVGATDTGTRSRADFSNYGSWVSVAAPGVAIYSSVPQHSSMWGDHAKPAYAIGDGTSFSTPLVVGEVALLKAQNPSASAGQLRRAALASAHGYSHLGLGHGQVDFVRAFEHLPPTSTPSGLTVAGTSGTVTLSAQSTARRVAFRVDGERRLRSVAVRGGTASQPFATWGFANGHHRLRAYDCTAYDECSGTGSTTDLDVENPSPVISSPAPDSTVTGRLVVTASSAAGGPLRLLLDGHSHGFDDQAPYAFPLSTSDLPDGAHTLQVQGCSADHRRCAGPKAAAVTVESTGLHPRVVVVTPAHVSPNGDHVRDTAIVRFRLPDRQTVRIRALSARGANLRSYSLGDLAAGTHTWIWRALGPSGKPLADGKYYLALDTVSGSRRGWVTTTAYVDTTRPGLVRRRATVTRFYPFRDGYGDQFRVPVSLGEAGTLTLRLQSRSGHVVRTIHLAHSRGPATIIWNGRRANGRRVPAGTYRWRLSLTDLAGNTTALASRRVEVSDKRLRQETRLVTRRASQYREAGGTAACAYARTRSSAFQGGLRLVNGCPSAGFDLAYADYVFRLPPALKYERITFQVRGAPSRRPAELSAAFDRTDGSVEIPRFLKVHQRRTSWYSIASVPAAHHVGRHGRTRLSLLLDSFYPGRNEFDAALVRVRVRVTVLR